MGSCYELRLSSNETQKVAIEAILGKSNGSQDFSWWQMIVEENTVLYTKALPHFLDLIELHTDELRGIGISSDMITIWYLYAYENQCNMEFDPGLTLRLGKLGITLCISCWEK
ncbi:hypothetical protein [Pedobacter sp. FW305-3-2-15-E-R2A2]|uniref:hypothetical protein n=1 Tax=Pedobacter sp. FW305-3-2-15-E-R2A2 TaxID=3140251 RepID=UPI0031400070